jgi:ubiquinone/menaquinone biosynthesis C-methylase UbiE
MQTEHHRHHPSGPVWEAVYALSMLFGRGAMARAVADLADLSAGDVVVDVGCGPGTAARRARREGATRAVGVDPSPQMLRLARWVTSLRRMDGVSFQEGPAESLPLDSASATVVWAIQSVHHWEDRSRGLKESLRVLASRGRLILLERSVAPGARGHATHGLTEEQADDVALQLNRVGFAEVTKRIVRVGRRNFVALVAGAPTS